MKNLIVIGKIGAPHGVKGEVRVTPLTDFPDRFQALKAVYLDETRSLEIESVKQNKQFFLLKFRGVNDRDGAALLRGKLLKVPRSQAAPLGEGEYYSFDIIGLRVYDGEDDLGEIKEIIKTGSNDVYVVKSGDRETLVPALKQVVKQIDLDAGLMRVCLQEELN